MTVPAGVAQGRVPVFPKGREGIRDDPSQNGAGSIAMTKVSPFAPARFPALAPIAGVRLATAAAHIAYEGRDDVLLVDLAPRTVVAGAFTRSKCASAPVDWCRKALKSGAARALVVNAGNANAFTGREGAAAVMRTVQAASEVLDCRPSTVYVASTGVIGEALREEKITALMPKLKKTLAAGAWEAAARAIMTTDTYPKGATRTAAIHGTPVTINGFTKGAGMIAPDMATTLGFVFTDAAIGREALQAGLSKSIDTTYNSITVEGDTSTSDTVLVFATGAARNKRIADLRDPALKDFRTALEAVLGDLARQIARDGEGISKFLTIQVTGAASPNAARRIGLSIANSPLVKTAAYGADANWGRIVMAVGKAGEKADRDKLAIAIGGVPVAMSGGAVPDYDETSVVGHMKGREIEIAVDVGVGRGRAVVWTCDMTHDFISANADYRS